MTELKYKLQRLIETITGKHCKNCKHHDGFFCDSVKKDRCSNSIFPVGWEKTERRCRVTARFKIKKIISAFYSLIVVVYIIFGLWLSSQIAFNHGTGYGIISVILAAITLLKLEKIF